MKKILISAFAAAASVAAFAGKDNVVITFSTPGIPDLDRYSDGMIVRDGEKYALVWTPNGSDFAGINSNGEAVPPSEVVAAVPLASEGKCPPVQFQVDEAVVTNKYRGGSWSVVMLDTRNFELDGDGKPIEVSKGVRAVDSVGGDNPVIGYGIVSTAQVVVGAAGDVLSDVAASGEAASDTPAPVVESIDVSGDSVIVTVSGTKSPFKYRLISGKTPDAVKDVVEGDESSDFGDKKREIITLKMPKEDGVKFFKVDCK